MTNSILSVLIENDTYVLRMTGELRFSLAPCIQEALNTIQKDKSLKNVIIDLNQARSVDSTVIGTLLNFFMKEDVWSRFESHPPCIVSKNVDIIKTFVNIGVEMFFAIEEFDPRLKSLKGEFVEIEKMKEDEQILSEYIRASHRTLSKLNPRSDFGSVSDQIKH